jgi:hypothetical protein
MRSPVKSGKDCVCCGQSNQLERATPIKPTMQDRIDARCLIFLRFSEEQRFENLGSAIVAGGRGIWDSGALIWDAGAQIWDTGAKIWDSGAVALTTESACRCLEKFKESLERQ